MRYRSRSKNYDESHRSHRSKYDSKYDRSSERYRDRSTERYRDRSNDRYRGDCKSHKRSQNKSRYGHCRDSEREDSRERKSEMKYKKYSKIDHLKNESQMERKSLKDCRKSLIMKSNSDEEIKDLVRKSRERKERIEDKDRNEKKSSNDKSDKDKYKEKDKKVKKKSKKCEKEKKKRKRHKQSSDEEVNVKPIIDDIEIKKDIKHEKVNTLLEPFKLKETSKIVSHENVFSKCEKLTEEETNSKVVVDHVKSDNEYENQIVKCEDVSENNVKDIERKKFSGPYQKDYKNSLKREPDVQQGNYKYDDCVNREKSRSPSKFNELRKSKEAKEKRNLTDRKSCVKSEDKKRIDDTLFEEERLELPRIPTDAQFAGLFTRLAEDVVSDTEIEVVLPPVLLDDQMKALIENDCNVSQELWDSEDDILINKKESNTNIAHHNILETLSVPWDTLLKDVADKNNTTSEKMNRFSIPHLFQNVAISKRFSDELLLQSIEAKLNMKLFNHITPFRSSVRYFDDDNNKLNVYENKPFAGGLSARSDYIYRKVIFKRVI